MDSVILLIFIALYIFYTEIRIRNIKKQKTKIYVPKELFENLKDTFQYINTSIEMIKEKQENINNLYIKIMELKKEIENWDSIKNKKRNKTKTVKNDITQQNHPIKENINQKVNQVEQEIQEINQETIWEKLVEETNQDKIDFSFLSKIHQNKEEKEPLLSSSQQEIKSNFLRKMGITFRKIFNLPEIPTYTTRQKDFYFKQQNQNIDSLGINTSNMISLEEYQKRLKQSESQSEEISNQEANIPKEEVTIKSNVENPKQILIQEAKKIFSEIQQKEEKLKMIRKLIEIGFTEEEIHQITNLTNAELSLIIKFRKKA